MKKKHVLPVAVLSSALLVGSLAPAQVDARVPQVSTEQIAEKNGLTKGNVPFFVKEKQAEKQQASNEKAAKNYLEKHKEKFKMKNPKANLRAKEVKTDDLGMTHVRMQQTKNGVPVEGVEVIVHYNKNNAVTAVNGHFNPSIEEAEISTEPTLTKEEALSTAKEVVNAPEVLDYEPSSKLVIYPSNDQNRLAYKVNVNFLGKNPGNWFVFVDAHTGEVLDQYNAIMDVDQYSSSKGFGFGVLGDRRNLHITHKAEKKSEAEEFYLYDNSHENLDGIYTYDLNHKWGGLPGEVHTNTGAAFTEEYDRPAVDAHYNSEKVYEYYLEEHDRNSIDGEGMAIKSSVHFGEDYNNAFWNGEQMTYGDGDGKFFVPLSAGLDVAAHEMTHGVTTYTAGLVYEFQSGALNEAFSDIFGALIDEEDWEVGEDIMAEEAKASGRTSLRSLSNPGKYPVGASIAEYSNEKADGMYPSHMDEYYDLPEDVDNGGVHINSSIINHAAYLTGKQIGKDKLGQIYYRALTTYLTPKSDFSDARHALIQSAVDIYGEGSPEAIATEDGLNQVGITE